MMLGDFVRLEPGHVRYLGRTRARNRRGAIDQVQGLLVVYQQVAPLQIVVELNRWSCMVRVYSAGWRLILTHTGI